jgi:hypothetical protein
MRRALTWAVVAVLATGALASTAGAGTPFRDTIHDEWSFQKDDFCDVSGLTVDVAGVIDIRIQVSSKGRDGLDYFLQHYTRTETLSANGVSLRRVSDFVEKDLHVTSNGDGTLTVLGVGTGNDVLYGPNGKAIARNPGQKRFELLIDDNGTPDDPFDDVVLDQQVVRDSTGRNDDFCDAEVAAFH